MSSGSELSEGVLKFLEKLLRHDGESALLHVNAKKPGLLTAKQLQGKTSPLPYFDAVPGLIQLRVEKTGDSEVKFVRLTRKGIEVLFRDQPEQHLPRRLSDAAPIYQRDAREVAVQILAEVHQRLSRQRAQLRDHQTAILVGLQDIVRAVKKEAEQEEADRAERERMVADLAVLVPAEPSATSAPQPDVPPPAPDPLDEADLDFQSAVAHELVFAIRDAEANEETVLQLERVLDNTPGVERVEEPDDLVEFNGMFHETHDGLNPGDTAVVVRSGWRLTNSRGVKLLARARVRQA